MLLGGNLGNAADVLIDVVRREVLEVEKGKSIRYLVLKDVTPLKKQL